MNKLALLAYAIAAFTFVFVSYAVGGAVLAVSVLVGLCAAGLYMLLVPTKCRSDQSG